MAPRRMINAEFIFRKTKDKNILATAIAMVRQSVITSFPMVKQTETISATEAMLTASKKAENNLELRINLKKGFKSATNTKDGRKTATVVIRAPQIPLI